MAKELYIYSPLYSFTAETVVKQLNDISDEDDLTFRINSPGGEVTAGWSIISKLSERTGKTKAIIDGEAQSMSALMLLFFDEVIANDTSRIMFHKAAYPSWYKASESELAELKKINAQFKEKLTAKVSDSPEGKAFLTKVFEADVRNDVSITPKEAKAIGIINEVKKLQPTAYDMGMQIVAMVESVESEEGKTQVKANTPESGANNKSKNSKKMTKEEFKLANPTAYAEIVNEGTTAERDRVEAWAVFNEVDPEKVKAGIESGSQLSAKAMAEFSLQAQKGKTVAKMEEENVDEVETPAEKATKKEIEAKAQDDAFAAEFLTGDE